MVLNVAELSFSYNSKQVLKNISWDWNTGQQWAVLGPNGAGKTTLAKALTQQIYPSAGSINFHTSIEQSSIAYVCFEEQKTLCLKDWQFDDSEFQNTSFDTGVTVQQAILGSAQITERFIQLVTQFKLKHILGRGIRFISTGEIRKTLLLRALISDPQLIILDNPFDGLDKTSQEELQIILRNLMQSEIAFLLLCRQVEDITAGITHVLALDKGIILAQGEKTQTIKKPEIINVMSPALPALASLPTPGVRSYQLDETAPLLELRNVSVSYQHIKVLNQINWTFLKGQHACISGPNGCGKTTLLSLINGNSHKAYGQNIHLFGQLRGSGESIWDIKQKFGIIDMELQLKHVRGMKSIEIVLSGFFDTIGLYDDWSHKQHNIAQQWLVSLGIGEQMLSFYDDLSFGLQRMVLLARAMVKSPAILILDEPCLGLDNYHRRLLLRAVDHIANNSDTQVLFVSHTSEEIPQCINQFLEFKGKEASYYLECTVA